MRKGSVFFPSYPAFPQGIQEVPRKARANGADDDPVCKKSINNQTSILGSAKQGWVLMHRAREHSKHQGFTKFPGHLNAAWVGTSSQYAK